MNKLFLIADNDTVVAETADEAFALWSEETGYTLADLDEGMDDVVAVPDANLITAYVEADGEIGEHDSLTAKLIRKSALEWASDAKRKGVLFSSEY